MHISVIIPVYNAAATLPSCLDALFACDYGDYEVLVVDDGSTDRSREIAGCYPCRLLALPRNVGAARAKNHGAEAASGEVLFFTDADIRVPHETLSWIAEDLADPEVDGVVGLLAEHCPYDNFGSQFKNLWMHYTYRRQPRRVGLFFTSAAAIRRRVFMAEGGFDPHYVGASITEDIEFGQRLLTKGYCIVMDQRLMVEHDKHYSATQVLRTDLLRARGLILTWLRNRMNKRAHYASVPWFFGAGVLALGCATLSAILAIILKEPRVLYATLGCVIGALLLNAPFLAALWRWRGVGFGLLSGAFLLADLYASGLGIALGILDLARGRRY